MSAFAMTRPLTPSSKHPDLKALSPKHHRQCWTLPPPDRSISANGLDTSLTHSPTNQRYERKARTPGIRPSLSSRASPPHSPTKADLHLNSNTQNLFLDPNIRKGPSVLFSPGSLAQRLEVQPPLATRLMRDSERRELEKIDVFSPKPRGRQPLIEVSSTTPIRSNNGASLKPGETSGVPTSPFVKCLLSNTPARLPSKISVESPRFGFNNPPKLRRLSITAESAQDVQQNISQGGHSIIKEASEVPIEKSTRPLPHVTGTIQLEVISSPISPLRDHEFAEQMNCQNEELPDLLSSSPVRDIDEEDPFMSCSKRRKISGQ